MRDRTSYPRNKIKILLLENISDAAVREFGAGGYMQVERLGGAVSGSFAKAAASAR